MTDSPQRISWIDEYKGFVLLLVCLYHVEQSFTNIQMGMEHLSALRMSAFFFISGVLFSTRRFPKFKDYCVHKSHVLLFPYVALSFLFLALDPVIYNFDWFPRAPRMVILNTNPVIHDVKDYIGWNFAKIFIAGKSSIGSGPIWFVFTLYSISSLFYLVQKIASVAINGKPGSNSAKSIIAFFAIASLAAGWTMYKSHIRLPLGIERDCTTLFFFACGYLSKDFIKFIGKVPKAANGKKKFFATLRHGFLLLACATLCLTLYAIIEHPDPNFSIMNNDLGKSFIRFFAGSAFGIFGLVFAFQFFALFPNNFIKGILRNISRNALVILAVHWWILLVLRIVFKADFDKPGIAYITIAIVTIGVVTAIPLFRCKLYKLLGKEKISVRESLSIK